MADTRTVSILGTDYEIFYNVEPEFDNMLKGKGGYISFVKKKIVLADLSKLEGFKDDEPDEIKLNTDGIIRHEVIHAFLYESGLCANTNPVTSWADNEEMVDWMAIQFSKILEVFELLDVLPKK